MTPKQAKKLLADGVLQAFAEGRKVEWRQGHDVWRDASDSMVFDALGYEYRVKPEPRRVWVRFLNKRAFYVFGSEDEAREASEEFPVCPPENEIVEFVEVMKP